jgi:hypothetical protein
MYVSISPEKEALRQIQLEKVRRLQMEEYKYNPMLWLEERFGEKKSDFRWSLLYEGLGHTWDGDKNPLYRAWRAIANGQWAGIEACTGSSKTYWLARVVLWFLDTHKDSLVVTSAPKQDQLKLHLWAEIGKIFYKFKKLRPKAALYNLRLVVEETDETAEFDYNNPDLSKSWQAVGFVAGVKADEQSATKAQGFHRKDMLIIMEETPGMPAPVMTAFQNTCTGDNNMILAVGNPDSQLDPLHIFCELANVAHFRVSAYDFPNVVLGKELMPGAVTRASIDRRLIQYRDVNSSMYLSRVRGISPSQSSDSLIQLDWLKNCRNHELLYDYSYHSVGVDVANSMDGDKAALAWFHGNQLMSIQEFPCKNANDLAYNLTMNSGELLENRRNDYETGTIQEHEVMDGFIGVDVVGVGVATVNALIEQNFNPVALQGAQWDEVIPIEQQDSLPNGNPHPNFGKPIYRFQNLRSQMAYELRIDLQEGNIKINMEDETEFTELCKECIAIRFKESGSYVVVESKENIKKRLGSRSPNKFDALMYANWVRKGYRLFTGIMPILAGNSPIGR